MITFIDIVLLLILWLLAVIVSRLTQLTQVIVDNDWLTKSFLMAYWNHLSNDLKLLIEANQEAKVQVKVNKKTNGSKTAPVSGN